MMNLNALQRSFPSHLILAHHGTNESEHAILRAAGTGNLSVVELNRQQDGGWKKIFEHAVTADQAVHEYIRAIRLATEARLRSNKQDLQPSEILF